MVQSKIQCKAGWLGERGAWLASGRQRVYRGDQRTGEAKLMHRPRFISFSKFMS